MESRMLGNLHVRFGERDYGNLFPKGNKAPCPYSTRKLIARKYDGSANWRPGPPATKRNMIRDLVLRMAEENPTVYQSELIERARPWT